MKNLIVKRILGAAILITLLAATTQIASARVHSETSAPDAASTSLLMGIACAGLAVVRRIKR